MSGSKAGRAACLSTYLAVTMGALTSFVEAKDGDVTAPWSEKACNDVCAWWMQLGDKPAAEVHAIDAQPKPPAQALSLPAMDILPTRAAKVMIDPFKGVGPAPRKAHAVVTRTTLPVATGAPVEPRSRWGVPIAGGSSIRPAWFEATH